MAFGKKQRSFKSLTARQNQQGPASQAEQRSALRVQSAHIGGLKNQAEKDFVKGTAGQDQGRVHEVLKRVRRANRKKM